MEKIRVIESFGWSRPTTNPYITMLGQSLENTPGIILLRFSWKSALTAKYDVFHFHWPEALLDGRTWYTRFGKDAAFFLLLLRIRLGKIAVVRTVHNLELPQGLPYFRRQLIIMCNEMTTLRIAINPVTPIESDIAQHLIPHGHYSEWFEAMPRQDQVPGRFVFTGLIRRYKGVENLIGCFKESMDDRPEFSLSITGKPSTSQLAETIQSAAEPDKRIKLSFGYVPEATLVAAITEAELVVLPYQYMHNSGSALAALSLHRPVLVPRNEVNELLSREVGAGWVHLYDGELTKEDLESSMASLRDSPPTSAPDLSDREWSAAGIRHREAFLEALGIATQK